MKTKITFLSFITLISIAVLVFHSCEENDEPDEPSNNAPNCLISSPEDGSLIIQGETVSIGVLASDSDGNIKEVRFAIDGIIKDTVRNSPYIYNWETGNESFGPHDLRATSIDNEGDRTSDEITVQIIEPTTSVTFNVNMSYQVQLGYFDPNNSNLDISGTFNGWTGTSMYDPDNDLIFSVEIFDIEIGSTIEFKCRRNGEWDGTEEFVGGSNRTYAVQPTGNELLFWYTDEEP